MLAKKGALSLSLFSSFVLSTQIPYSEYILAPSSRLLTAREIYMTNGTVQNAACLTSDGSACGGAVFVGVNSSVTLDFGKNIAGTVQFNVDSVNGPSEFLGFSFTESSEWISPYECDATQNSGRDAPLWFPIGSSGSYGADKYHQRGGFRYMSVWHNSSGTLSLSDIKVNWTASPSAEDPQSYLGYFHSSSEKLNRVWYAGAYTNQLCTISTDTGSALSLSLDDWYYNATLTDGAETLVDGAKRDRLIWPGDVVISQPSLFVSTNSLDATKTAIDALLANQQSNGQLPYYVGPPLDAGSSFTWSFTYHLHSLNDIHDYYIYTGDIDYLKSVWSNYTLGMNYIVGTVDSSGLANVTSSNDWLRSGMGGHNIEANAILYYNLGLGVQLAQAVGDATYVQNWTATASTIQSAANSLLWDSSQNLFKDNEGSTLYPQDGNSWAVFSGLVSSASQASSISDSLMARWNEYGAPAPEAGATVSPFSSSFELKAHYAAGHADRAVNLTEFMWHDFMLEDPRMTNSSFIEGYSTNGSLHYEPYSNDPRVSHAHGWSTGPTSILTFNGAGIQLRSGGGQNWTIVPSLGGLNSIEAGFQSPLGMFSASWTQNPRGLDGDFETPQGSTGTLVLPASQGNSVTISGPGGNIVQGPSFNGSTVTVNNLTGGNYTVRWSS